MLSHRTFLPLTVALAFGVLSAFGAPQAKTSKSAPTSKTAEASKKPAAKTHVLEGSVVSMSTDSLIVRSGKKDMTFKLNSTTQKPTTVTPGSSVKVTYHDDGTQHIASDIQAMAPKSSIAAKQPARK